MHPHRTPDNVITKRGQRAVASCAEKKPFFKVTLWLCSESHGGAACTLGRSSDLISRLSAVRTRLEVMKPP